MERTALWFLVGLFVLGMLGCGNSRLTSVNLTPAAADAQNFPNGQVQFSATGTYGSSSKKVPLNNITWCAGTSTGVCNGNIASPISVSSSGLAQCNGNANGTFTVLAGTGPQPQVPDAGQQLTVYGTAQLTCP